MVYKILLALLTTTIFAGPLRTNNAQQFLNSNVARNYIINSGAENNILNITNAAAIATRTTTGPLEGVASFSIDGTADTEKVIFLASDFQQGLMGQSCEWSINITGDATLYKMYSTLAGVTVSSVVTGINSGSSTQRYSGIFPCGNSLTDDPALVVEATGNGAVIKGDSAYLGQTVSVGSAAQATAVLSASRFATQTISTTTATVLVATSAGINSGGAYNTSTGVYTVGSAGRLTLTAGGRANNIETGTLSIGFRLDGVAIPDSGSWVDVPSASNTSSDVPYTITGTVDVLAGQQITLIAASSLDTSYTVDITNFTMRRFPTASELVYKIGTTLQASVEAYGTPTGGIDGATTTIWGTEQRDVTNSYNHLTGVFTAPISGDYCFTAGATLVGQRQLTKSF